MHDCGAHPVYQVIAKSEVAYQNAIYSTSFNLHYRQLLESTCRIANVLKREGVKKGDRVAVYMPASPLLAATMLACARIGAIHR